MANKLTKKAAEELDKLVHNLKSKEPEERSIAIKRLIDFERSGRVPLESLLQISKEGTPAQVMYAISALGRNSQPAAVNRLMEMLEKNKREHPLLLETIVDALGKAKNKQATEPLLKLLGLRLGATGKLLSKMKKTSAKTKSSKEDSNQETIRNFVKLPVIRALKNIGDDRVAPLVGYLLEDKDVLVRWHTLEVISLASDFSHLEKIKDMEKNDESHLVKEKASIVLEIINRYLSKQQSDENAVVN